MTVITATLCKLYFDEYRSCFSIIPLAKSTHYDQISVSQNVVETLRLPLHICDVNLNIYF